MQIKNITFGIIFAATQIFAFQSNYLSFKNNIKCDQLLHKRAFDVCYDYSSKTPKAVVYSLTKNLVNANNFSRKNLRFKPDKNIPKRYRSYSHDYVHSGYDRGHNAPNAAFDYDRRVQKETFLMSNIAPQAKWLNRKYWAKVERLARFLASKYGKDEVITGNCGSIGKLKNKVNVPKWWYKIIYIPSIKQTVAFLAPNTNSGMKYAKIKKYMVDLKKINRVCRIRFLFP